MVEPAVTAALLTIGFAVLSTLVGLAYRNLKNRIEELEDGVEDAQDRKSRLDTIWAFLFGLPEDQTDTGLSGDIEEGFESIEKELEDTQSRQQKYHTEEMDAIENLANALHDEEDIEIEREDVLPEK